MYIKFALNSSIEGYFHAKIFKLKPASYSWGTDMKYYILFKEKTVDDKTCFNLVKTDKPKSFEEDVEGYGRTISGLIDFSFKPKAIGAV